MKIINLNYPFLTILIIVFVLVTGCQSDVEQDPIPQHDTFTIQSKIVNEKRVITVWTPPDYNHSSDPLPVLYMLDGGVKEDFPHIANTISSLVAKGEIAPVILVGIENTERRRDLTGSSQIKADAKIAPITDGSSQFREFFKTELFIAIKKRYRVTEQRAIVGESIAGLFIVETMLLEPNMFDIYLAIDPSLWWNNHYLVRNASILLKKLPKTPLKFWFTGSDAKDIYLHTENIMKILQKDSPENLEWLYLPQPNQQHHTIFRASKVTAFKWGLWKKSND